MDARPIWTLAEACRLAEDAAREMIRADAEKLGLRVVDCAEETDDA